MMMMMMMINIISQGTVETHACPGGATVIGSIAVRAAWLR